MEVLTIRALQASYQSGSLISDPRFQRKPPRVSERNRSRESAEYSDEITARGLSRSLMAELQPQVTRSAHPLENPGLSGSQNAKNRLRGSTGK